MKHQEQFEEALRAPQPMLQLRNAVCRLLAQGQEREAIVKELERFRDNLRDKGREQEEDLVLEVLDYVTGWSSPHMNL